MGTLKIQEKTFLFYDSSGMSNLLSDLYSPIDIPLLRKMGLKLYSQCQTLYKGQPNIIDVSHKRYSTLFSFHYGTNGL